MLAANGESSAGMIDYEKLGLFYLGRQVDAASQAVGNVPLLYEAADLVTHAVILGMTGSGKTGLGIGLIEEAIIDGVPVIAIDPKGDLANLLLAFPKLDADEFAPWVNPDEARLLGIRADAFAAHEAARWRDGLAESGQSSERVARYRDAARATVFTPGSRSARPLSILRTFAAPPAAIGNDPELRAERASAAATSVLTLAGIESDAHRSREHILIATLLSDGWQRGHTLDLPALIAQVQSPPLERVGVMEIEACYPANDRFRLASDLNRVLASPDFAVWLEGDPLDIDALLYDAGGTPRLSVISIAHLDDRERMFFMSLLLNELVSWMRLQRGTSTLRALVYIDEMMGFLPPVAMPPSKPPLLTLLKQARAFGLGMTLATQNSVDLDYKALANAGTWFLGRLQTERDKARLLDGLEGSDAAAASDGFDRATTDRLLSSLPKRTFLLHNVHAAAPVLFKTRWTLSYLRGPLGRDELSRLVAPDNRESAESAPRVDAPRPNAPRASHPVVAPGTAAPRSDAPRVAPGTAAPRSDAPRGSHPVVAPSFSPPVVDPAIQQYFAPAAADVSRWVPAVLGAARLSYSDAKRGINDTRDIVLTTPIGDGPVTVDWEHAEPADFSVNDLSREPSGSGVFASLPPGAVTPRASAQWSKDFARWAAHSQAIELMTSVRSKIVSTPDESERDFRIRLQTKSREGRDQKMAELRERYAAKLATLDDRIRRAQAGVEREEQQAADSQLQAGVSVAATIFGALLGRKALSASTLGRATTAARGAGRIGRASQDVARAKAETTALQAKRDELARRLDEELQAVAATWDARDEPLERVLVKPQRGGVAVQLVALVWIGQ